MIVWRNPTCAACGGPIRGKYFTPARSFDLYHPDCYVEPTINWWIDEAPRTMSEDDYRKIQEAASRSTPLPKMTVLMTDPHPDNWVKRRFVRS